MPNGEGIPNPRYRQADAWRSYLLGVLSGAIDKTVGKSVEIIEIDANHGWIILRTSDGNFKIELTVSF